MFLLQVRTLGCESSPMELFMETYVRSEDHRKGVQQFIEKHAQHFVVRSFDHFLS